MLPDLSIKRETTVERIVETLRDALCAGDLEPGTMLREVELASGMNVSRGSVREALLRLADEGLVVRDSFRSVKVARLSADDIRDIYRVRKLIELNAVDAARDISEENLAVLKAAGESFAVAMRTGTPAEQNRADLNVHSALVGLSGSPRLSQLHSRLMSELQMVMSAQYRRPDAETGAELTSRHEEFIRLLSIRDFEAARNQLAQRLDKSLDILLDTAVAIAIPAGG